MDMSLEDMGWWYEMIAIAASRAYLEERIHAERAGLEYADVVDLGGEG